MTQWTTLTGAGALVVDDGRMLLVKQRRPYGVHWEFPSGYYEPGESFEQTAAREVLEETGVAVEIGDLLCTMLWERTHDRRRNVLAFFLADPIGSGVAPTPQVEEVLDQWAAREPRPFHVHVEISVNRDGTQNYAVRP